PQPRQLLALVGRQRAGASPAGIDLSLPHPCAQRCLGEIELPGDRPEALLAPLHQPDRLRLELRRERSPLPPSLLSHDTLLSHFRASWGVHETGANSLLPALAARRFRCSAFFVRSSVVACVPPFV